MNGGYLGVFFMGGFSFCHRFLVCPYMGVGGRVD